MDISMHLRIIGSFLNVIKINDYNLLKFCYKYTFKLSTYQLLINILFIKVYIKKINHYNIL